MSGNEIVVRVREGGAARTVALAIDSGDEPAVPFDFDAAPGTRTARVVRTIEEGLSAIDDLRDIGSQLWGALFPGTRGEKVRRHVEGAKECVTLKLELPPSLERLPWEALYDAKLRFIACHPRLCLIHGAARAEAARGTEAPPVPEPRVVGRLSILVVIPEGSGLDAATELANLRSAVAKLAGAVELVDLRGVVHPNRLGDTLTSRAWNVVHFIGHGRMVEGGVQVRLNDFGGGEAWLNAEAFSAVFQGAQIDACVLNCCYGGSATDERTMDRLAPALMDTGVRGVVAMRYAMADTDASNFSQVFYHQLLRGPRAGCIGYATQLARKSLLQNSGRDEGRSFVTPLVHVAADSDRLFTLEVGDPPPAVAVQAPAADIALVPPELLEAVRERRCVPVLGMDLVPPPIYRRGDGPPPGLRGLIERLSLRATELFRHEEADEYVKNWPPELLLSRLAERYESEDKWRLLVETVRDYYAPQQPSEIHRLLATWPVPGIFYTHFDGMMEASYAGSGRPRVVTKLTESPEGFAAGGGWDGAGQRDSLLVLVRGTISDHKSLVLTENDHFELSERLERMHASILALTRGYFGRSVLFLGAAPGDRVVRELGRKLLEAGNSRGPEPFFVSVNHPPSDELFWKRFRVRFVRVPNDVFVRGVCGGLGAR